MSRREIYKLCGHDLNTSVVCSTTIATILIFSANTSISVIRRYVWYVVFELAVSSQSDVVDAPSSAVGCELFSARLFVVSVVW